MHGNNSFYIRIFKKDSQSKYAFEKVATVVNFFIW
jgi:hypothetical protein